MLGLVTAGSVMATLAAAPAGFAVGTAGSGPDATILAGGRTLTGPLVRRPAAFAVSRPLRLLAGLAAPERRVAPGPSKRAIYLASRLGHAAAAPGGGAPDPVVQRAFGTGTIPAPLTSFEGVGQTTTTFRPIPPDTIGEIGPNHYVQMVNVRYAVYSRSGRALVPPTDLSVLFGPLGGHCGVSGVGDPVVLYDQLADRWLLSQFGFLSNQLTGLPTGPYYECIAISTTGDPTGSYYLYAFKFSDTRLNDYPKLGVWPDAYYMAANQFLFSPFGGGSYGGVGVAAFDRAAMIAGDPAARMVLFDLSSSNPNLGSMLPSDLDGFRPPPTGAPNTFVEVDFPEFGFPTDQLTVFQFHVDWDDTRRSSFAGPVAVPTAPFDPLLCNFASCIPQKGTSQKLDPLSDRLMQRLAYRNFGTHEALVLNHSVDVGGDHAGVRWYELRNPRAPVIHQQGTFAPDADHRWMGSIAMDGNGNIGLGYSVSGTSLPPSIRYTGQLAADAAAGALGQMTLGEGSIVAGTGAQTHTSGRWGDYSSMTVDPLDDCTFWYTNEYYVETVARDWRTRVGAFKVDEGCDATAPTARARPATAGAGKTARLAFTTADNSGRTSERIAVLRPNGSRLRTISTPLGADGAGAVSFRAPTVAGLYRWCLVATDAKGNESAESCARLRVR